MPHYEQQDGRNDPPKIMPVMGLMAPLRSGPLRAAGSIDPGKAISLTKPSFARNQPYVLHVLCDS
jgi:hypothetical protein